MNERSNFNGKASSSTKSAVFSNQITNAPQDVSEAFYNHVTTLPLNLLTNCLPQTLPLTPPRKLSSLHGDAHGDNCKGNKCSQKQKGHIDEIPVHIMKKYKDLFFIPLTEIFNQPINTGTFPEKIIC